MIIICLHYNYSGTLQLDNIIDSIDNVVGGDTKHLQEGIRRSRPWNIVDCKLLNNHVAIGGNSIQYCISNTSLIQR